jgi:hypothetical protein
MVDAEHERVDIERAIESARDGVSGGIDQLDRRLRQSLDFRSMAADHAPQLVAGAAVVGFFLGFGVPKTLSRLVQIAVPIVMVAVKIRSAKTLKIED